MSFLINHMSITSYLNELNEQQYKAATYPGKSLLVLAGAGSGKTKTLITRIAYFIKAGVSPSAIIAVTFTNKAAKELKERLQHYIPNTTGVYIGTFHRLSNLFLRKYGSFINVAQDFQIITPSDQKSIFKRIFVDLNREENQYCNHKNALNMLSRFYLDKTTKYDDLWQPVISGYLQYTHQKNLLDFDSLIEKAIELFANQDFKRIFSTNIQHLLIDEFQDTNPPQYRWIQELSSEQTHLTFVGDDDQSIYGFRGADVTIIQRVSNTYQDLYTIRLEQNYRSTPSILALANTIIAQNRQRLGKNLWTNNQEFGLPEINEYASEYEEAQGVCRAIHHLLHKGVDHTEIAILYRSNALSRLFEGEARKYQWPYKVSGGLPFFDREEIRDIMSYLQVIADPRQDRALLRIINKPARKIGQKTQDTLEEYAKQYQVSIWDAILALIPSFAPATKKALVGFVELIQSLNYQAQSLTFSDLTNQALNQTELLKIYQEQEQAEHKEDNLYEFVNAIVDFEKNYADISTIEQVKIFINEYFIDDSLNTDQEKGLTLSTCHAAKGLEWPYVFLVGMEKNIFPHENSQHHSEQEEERRLFYVAITRAKKQLRISYALKRQRFHEFLRQEPSPFITGLSPDLIKVPKASFQAVKTSVARPQSNHKKIIKHEIFGKGEVILLDELNDLITIKFLSVGQKSLRYSLAKKMLTDDIA